MLQLPRRAPELDRPTTPLSPTDAFTLTLAILRPLPLGLLPRLRPPDRLRRAHEVATWTKRDIRLDQETNIWPLDRRHHVGKKIREKRNWKWSDRDLRRRMKQKVQRLEFAVEDARFEDLDNDFERLDDDSILHGDDFHCPVCCCASEAGWWSANEASVDEVDLTRLFCLGSTTMKCRRMTMDSISFRSGTLIICRFRQRRAMMMGQREYR
jgi:hypothetical protein